MKKKRHGLIIITRNLELSFRAIYYNVAISEDNGCPENQKSVEKNVLAKSFETRRSKLESKDNNGCRLY